MKNNTCKHFNGTYHNTHCEAGVCYRDVTPEPDRQDGIGLRVPCRTESIGNNPSQLKEFAKRGTCEKFQLPTAEEIAADEAEIAKLFERTDVARRAIVKHLGGPWKRGMPGVGGDIKCPICADGLLRFSRAGINGHIHASCTTEDCVRWME